MSLKDDWTSITDKYLNQYLRITDTPVIGNRLVFLPKYDAMIYVLYEGAYEYFNFQPGDVMTVKKVEKQHPHRSYDSVYMEENKCTFTPAEFVPVANFDAQDIKRIKEIYNLKKEEKSGRK